MSKDERGRNSSLSEKPVRSSPRRLVDWINLPGAKKVHSLIDKVYKRKNLEMAWEKAKANRGSGGVDGQNLEAFEAQLEQQLDRLQRGAERGRLSISAGATTPHPEEGQSRRASNARHTRDLRSRMSASATQSVVSRHTLRSASFVDSPRRYPKLASIE